VGKVQIRKSRWSDSAGFLSLLEGLAHFEHLEPPGEAGRRRLLADIFHRRRLHLFVAADEKKLVGYALYFYSYSSFLAKPTLYIEDIFVVEGRRGSGIGIGLFRRCAEEAVKERCGRMEWAVLKWNKGAIALYEKLGAKRLDDWDVFRLDETGMRRASGLGHSKDLQP
jgi:GNAT superfamily N-acetyltransferase